MPVARCHVSIAQLIGNLISTTKNRVHKVEDNHLAITIDESVEAMTNQLIVQLQENTYPRFNPTRIPRSESATAIEVALDVELAPISQQWIGVFALLANIVGRTDSLFDFS